ncbi:MAG: DUF1761 domain-containing protein [Jiangellaceae bacterium]
MSFDVLGELNWLAVIVAAIAYFALGAIWYAPPVMGNVWMRAGGMQMPAEGERPSPAIYLAPWWAACWPRSLGMLAEATGTDTAGEGLVLGVVVAVGFVLTVTMGIAMFESNKPKQFTWGAAHTGYYGLGIIVAALIIGAWQ